MKPESLTITLRRVNASTLVSSESMQERNASSVIVVLSRTTPLVLVGAGVVSDTCRFSISALWWKNKVNLKMGRSEKGHK